MKIGTVKEIKRHEYRVGLTPSCVRAYASNGHEVFVQNNAGVEAGFENSDYVKAGAKIVDDPKNIFDNCEMIIKVKEPQPEEYDLLHKDQTLYTFLHLAANPKLTEVLIRKCVKAVAYETIQLEDGSLPCLKPMSEIAGRLAVQEGAKYLEKPFGGRGVLLGGVPGVPKGNIAIIGGGTVGINACKIAAGIGANVTVLDINQRRLEYFDDIFGSRVNTLYCNDSNIENVIHNCDMAIGAVLLPGAKTPKIVKAEQLKTMKPHSVIVDVSVDQGGCFETSSPTTHDNPTYIVDGIIHYCVANMPGAVAMTSTIALTQATLRHGLMIAQNGIENACRLSAEISKGLNIYNGKCVYEQVAESLGIKYTPIEKVI